jgi:hypothetical protein
MLMVAMNGARAGARQATPALMFGPPPPNE